MLRMVRIDTRRAPKGHEHQPEAIEGCQESRQQTEERQYLAKSTDDQADTRMSSLLKNPAVRGKPASDNEPITNVQ